MVYFHEEPGEHLHLTRRWKVTSGVNIVKHLHDGFHYDEPYGYETEDFQTHWPVVSQCHYFWHSMVLDLSSQDRPSNSTSSTRWQGKNLGQVEDFLRQLVTSNEKRVAAVTY